MIDALMRNPVAFAAVLCAIAAGILIPLTRWSLRRERAGWTALSAAVQLVSGSFIFISAFVMVTVWQSERNHEGLIVKEFAAAANFAEDVVWYMKAGELDPTTGNLMLDDLRDYGQTVREDELTQVTGLPDLPPARGSARADLALQSVGQTLDEYAFKARIPGDSSLWQWWRELSDSRAERLAMRTPLPGALLGIMLVTAAAILILIGVCPPGEDVTVRWIAATVSGVVVVAVLVTISLLINPTGKQVARQGPVDELNAVIDSRP